MAEKRQQRTGGHNGGVTSLTHNRCRRAFVALAAICAAVITVGQHGYASAKQTANQSIYFNGDIVTMEGATPSYVEALVEQDGKIIFVGQRNEATRRFPNAFARNLNGQTLVPGFIDGHGHMYIMGLASIMANVRPAPDGPGTDFEALIRSTQDWMRSENGRFLMGKTGWVVANGYDDSLLTENATPTAEVLDQITKDYPVLLIHQSGHVGTMNHKGLEMAGFKQDTPNPPGGVLRRKADGSLDGVIEESALTNIANAIMFRGDPEMDMRAISRGQQAYLEQGFTTAQEGRAFPNITRALAQAATAGLLRVDVVSYPDITVGTGAMTSEYYRSDRAYVRNYRIGGVKVSLDGSPQAKTAWLTHPYHIPPPHESADYAGYAAMAEAKAFEYFDLAASKQWQILCHANGDAAIDQCLEGVARAQSKFPDKNHRSVVIHGQTMRKDQVARLAQLNMLTSLFAAHTYYWGDYHRSSVLGKSRADRISPTRDIINAGMTLTSHHDAPVILPSAMRVLDATVNRTTRSGKILGRQQRLTPYEALKTITIWAAVQHFEETSKGTLTVGKRADFAVLSANPLKVKPGTIKDIRISATIKDGRMIYCAVNVPRSAICQDIE